METTKVNWEGVFGFLLLAAALLVLLFLIVGSGCVTAYRTLDNALTPPAPTTAPPVPHSVVTVWTPAPTPSAIPTLEVAYVNPFDPGLRFEYQWFQWWRTDVQGLKDLRVGVVVYRHKFLDRYTWWNPSQGNYFTQRPSPGNRYFAVWVHEEMLGNTTEFDPSFWAFDDRAFALQVKDQLVTSADNSTFNPVNRILEFDEYTDYYDTVTAPPFGYYVKYTGHIPKQGGYEATKIGVLRMGPGNAHDGFLLFEVPRETQIKDVLLLGAFSTFGNAAWRFD